MSKEKNIIIYRCNKCTGDISRFEDGINTGDYGVVDVTYVGGYYSKHLDDLSEYKFSLCEKCLSELFASFKIPVIKDEEYFQKIFYKNGIEEENGRK